MSLSLIVLKRLSVASAHTLLWGVSVSAKGVQRGLQNMTDLSTLKMHFDVIATRLNAQSSQARCDATISLDTGLAGNSCGFNPAELLLAALSACMIKGIERVAPILKFDLRGLKVHVHGVRQDVPPRLESIHYEIEVDTDEPEHRLALLHENVRKYGTVFNTVVPGTTLSGILRRKEVPS